MTMFTAGITFVSGSTVIPTLVALLTNSPILVGLISGLTSGAWLLPQLFVAAWAVRFPRKKPILVTSAIISRTFFFVTGLAIGLLGTSKPVLTLAILILGQVAFFFFDAIASVPWFDLLAKTIPARRRGRVLGIGQVLGAICGILVGFAVRFILGTSSPWAFPWNFAVLFFSAGTILMVSIIMLAMIREAPSPVPADTPPGMKQMLASLPALIRQDKAFGKMLLTRLVVGFASVATSFYVIYATRDQGLGTDVTGLLLSAQVVGSLLAGLLIGALQDRRGVMVYMRVVIVSAMLPPIMTLITGLVAPHLGSARLVPYLVIFGLLGIYMNSVGWPFFSWMLEHAPESKRPLYIGVSNTLGALTMAAPPLGGLLVNTLGYPAVFIAALVFAVGGLLLSFWLPAPSPHLENPQPS